MIQIQGRNKIGRTIDLHVHLVPGVDDGPATWVQADELLGRLRTEMPSPALVVATPHIRLSMDSRVRSSQEDRVQDYLAHANSDGSQRDFTVLAAREVMLDTGRMQAHKLDSFSIPGTSWILVELEPTSSWRTARKRIGKVIERGFRPLLAHPERYRWCERNPERVLELARMGTGIQVSARSLASSGPVSDTAWELLEAGYLHVLASDAHSAVDTILSTEFGSEVDSGTSGAYNLLTQDMPLRILDNMDLPGLPLFDRDG